MCRGERGRGRGGRGEEININYAVPVHEPPKAVKERSTAFCPNIERAGKQQQQMDQEDSQ